MYSQLCKTMSGTMPGAVGYGISFRLLSTISTSVRFYELHPVLDPAQISDDR